MWIDQSVCERLQCAASFTPKTLGIEIGGVCSTASQPLLTAASAFVHALTPHPAAQPVGVLRRAGQGVEHVRNSLCDA
jgi:hypothetical protein